MRTHYAFVPTASMKAKVSWMSALLTFSIFVTHLKTNSDCLQSAEEAVPLITEDTIVNKYMAKLGQQLILI